MGPLLDGFSNVLRDKATQAGIGLQARLVEYLARHTNARNRGWLYWVVIALLFPVGASGWLLWLLVGRPLPIDIFSFWWLLVAPLVSLCGIIVLLFHRPAAYWISLGVQTAFWFLSMLFLVAQLMQVTISDGETIGIAGLQNLWEGMSVLVQAIFLIPFLTLGLSAARTDIVPIDSRWGWLVYLGRRKHLESLYDLARSRGWEVSGLQGPNMALHFKGSLAGRDVYVESGYGTITHRNGTYSAYYLKLTVYSTRILWPIFSGGDILRPFWTDWQDATSLLYRKSKGGLARLYILPPSSEAARRGRFYRFGELLESQADLLTNTSRIQAMHYELSFERFSGTRLRDSSHDVDRTLVWLVDLVMAMEESGLCSASLPEQGREMEEL